MGNALLVYMIVIDNARQCNEINSAISIGKRYTNCPMYRFVI